jgi:hypothetical protein
VPYGSTSSRRETSEPDLCALAECEIRPVEYTRNEHDDSPSSRRGATSKRDIVSSVDDSVQTNNDERSDGARFGY